MSIQRKHKLQALVIAIMIMFAIFTAVFHKSDHDANRSNIEYIQSFGWVVDENPIETTRITLPDLSDKVFAAYCEKLQAQSGIGALGGKRVTRYSYNVLNHIESKNGLVRINIFVYNDTIVAADVSSLKENGFIIPISNTTDIT